MRIKTFWVIGCALFLAASSPQSQAAPSADGKTFKPEELDQLLAPIALHPDDLLAQILMASTYPLEVVDAARWSMDNPNIKEQALEEAMQQQPWDPSVKSLTAVPQVLEMMNEKLDWAQKLGDAFLAQPSDVMETVQGLRRKAREAGHLKDSKEQKITTEPGGDQTIIIIESTDPEVVYVPAYDPFYIYGSWWYPAYPPYYWYPPGYMAGGAGIGFGVGIIVGGAIWGDCDWDHHRVQVNPLKYNDFNRTKINNPDWQHNPEHRKGVGYRDAGVQKRYGSGRTKDDQAREDFRGRAEPGRAESDQARVRSDDRSGDRSRAGGAGQPGAFEGVDQGSQVRDYSNRGAASRGVGGGRGSGGGMRGGGGRR